jgi:hypothetical protein
MLLGKPIDSITENDLQALIDNKVPETKTIEYKESLPKNSDSDKKEFLADVSSFANASGGHLIFGIRESSGLPSELCGMEITNADAEIRRLENIIRDGLEPRISGLQTRAIPLQNGRTAIMIWIPKSWALPHRVTFQTRPDFYSRNSAGKYPLDVAELRTLFSLSESTAERMRKFRTERLSKLAAGEAPAALQETPKTVLHMIPFSAFDPSIRHDLSSLVERLVELRPLDAVGWNHRFNLDGFLTYCRYSKTDLANSYLQIFRNGSVEAVASSLLREQEGKKLGLGVAFENELINSVKRYLMTQKELGVEPPIVVMLSLLGVLGYTITAQSERFFSEEAYPISTDALILPEVIVETYENQPDQIMRPVFDAVWNAAGFSGSMNYNKNGKREVT